MSHLGGVRRRLTEGSHAFELVVNMRVDQVMMHEVVVERVACWKTKQHPRSSASYDVPVSIHQSHHHSSLHLSIQSFSLYHHSFIYPIIHRSIHLTAIHSSITRYIHLSIHPSDRPQMWKGLARSAIGKHLRSIDGAHLISTTHLYST